MSFNYGILDDVAHRPWPLPNRPWMMTQTWHDLLFAHWPVDRALLASKIPRGLELDLHDGQAWLGVVPFRMSHVTPRGVPAIRRLSAFPELNVRTYVRAAGAPGVYFFSLDAAHLEAVMIARALLHLPYRLAAMSVESDGSRICYRSRRTSFSTRAAFTATYAPTGPARSADPSSLDYFLTERYCLYTVRGRGGPRRLDIHHQPWPLQPATAMFECNTMADAIGVPLPSSPPVLHFAKRLDVLAWAPRPLEGAGDSVSRETAIERL